MKRVLLIAAAMLLGGTPAFAFNYVGQGEFKEWLETARPVAIVDILPADAFAKGHFPGAIETNAYPVKSDEERRRLDGVAASLATTDQDIVIICPRGGGGAKNTYDYLKEKGIAEKRLFILEKGAEGWPFKNFFVEGR
jgi:rhodanese-related sulfurtransferase